MKKTLKSNQFLLIATLLFSSLIFTSCKKDEPAPVDKTIAANKKVNTWIYENMQYWYLWNNKLPTNIDSTKKPDVFFESLLYKAEDRFSWIQENYLELLNSLEGVSKEAGYDFNLYYEKEGSNNVIAVVTYIKANSPVSSTSLKRGDIIYKINNKQITDQNYQSLLTEIGKAHSISFRPIDPVNETTLASVTVNLDVVEYAENPNYLSTVIGIGSHKIGYYVYNFFAVGDNSDYDNQMDAIFNTFKNGGITELVLDFRYNSGGAISSAINLASLIAPNVTKNDIALKSQYNAGIQAEIIADPEYGPDYLNDYFIEKTQNVGNILPVKKVYILTGEYTASASELIINSLRPYMEVIIIGVTTYGKNVGSISIYEENDPENTWGMQPIIVKTANSLGQSDYSNGFAPDIENDDSDPYLFPLGDTRETLLAIAISDITGGIVARKSNSRRSGFVGSSLLSKPRTFEMTVDKSRFKKLMKLKKDIKL